MKLTDFLIDIGRPVAYYPKLRKLTESTNANILLCQFIYWRGKQADPDGWLEKTSEEIEEETGLSYDEQKTARTKLVGAGFVQEKYARLDHKMRFLVNLDEINTKWASLQGGIPEHGNVDLGKAELPFSLNSNTENTTEKGKPEKRGDIFDGMVFYAQQAQERGIDKVEDLLVRLEKGIGVNIPRSVANQSVAKRLLKEEAEGRTVDQFLTWLRSDEWRMSHLYIYADPEKIWTIWPQAFAAPTTKPIEYFTPPKDDGEYISKEEAKRRGLAK